jgi:YHS domain-containing protein
MTFWSVKRAAACLAALGLSLTIIAPAALAEDAANEPPTPVEQEYELLDNKTDYPKPPKVRSTDTGIWKAVVPHDVKGEFDSYDPVGLMAGDLIKADCSLNWRDQDGRLYCFSSGTSLVYFKDWPQTYIRKARKAFHELTEEPKPGS